MRHCSMTAPSKTSPLPPPPTGDTNPLRASKGARCRAALLLLLYLRAYCENVLLAGVLEGQGGVTPSGTELTSMADD